MGYFFIHYNFIVPINSSSSIKQFWFSVDDKNGTAPTVYKNEGNYYVVNQDQVFFNPMMSQVNVVANGTSGYGTVGSGFTRVYSLVVAVRIFTLPLPFTMLTIDVFRSATISTLQTSTVTLQI
jgi:hypothetical protein